MLRSRISIFIFILIVFCVHASIAHAYTFSQNLKIGMSGNDVYQLQLILNKDPSTQIADYGVGSPGHESSYFGFLTQQAVIKLQNKYAQDILLPAGLPTGNGFVGPLTLKKLTALSFGEENLNNGSTSSSTDIPAYKISAADMTDLYGVDKKIQAIQDSINERINTIVTSHTKPDFSDITNFDMNTLTKVFLSRFSAQILSVGDTLTMTGIGFSGSNDVYFEDSSGNKYVMQGIQGNSTSLTIKIPELPLGRYDIAVKNADGISNSMFIVLTTDHANHVTISSITSVSYGQTVTIHGTGFSPQHNDVVTSLGTYKNISSSDGMTLSFVFTPAAFREISKLGSQHKQYPVTLSVISDNGISDVSGFLFSY